MHLRDLKVGEEGKIVGFESGSKEYRKKLLAMGLTTGAEFTVVRCAPLGDPVEISVRGFLLILRKDEADILKIDMVQETPLEEINKV